MQHAGHQLACQQATTSAASAPAALAPEGTPLTGAREQRGLHIGTEHNCAQPHKESTATLLGLTRCSPFLKRSVASAQVQPTPTMSAPKGERLAACR